jgi:hypothetical protein
LSIGGITYIILAQQGLILISSFAGQSLVEFDESVQLALWGRAF